MRIFFKPTNQFDEVSFTFFKFFYSFQWASFQLVSYANPIALRFSPVENIGVEPCLVNLFYDQQV
jgi:hypothetical protein